MNLQEILNNVTRLTDCITKVSGKEVDGYTMRVDNQRVEVKIGEITITINATPTKTA